MSDSLLALEPHQHKAGGGQDEEGEHEEQQAQQDQRGLMQIPALGEFAGDGRRNRGARRENRAGDAEGIADDEGHRHGLAQRPPQRQHDAADDAHAGIGNDHAAHHFPGGAAKPVGGLLQHGRHGVEHIARNRRDEGQDHDGQNERGVEQAQVARGTGEDHIQDGDILHRVGDGGLDGVGQHGAQHEEAPHAVDDGGNARQQLHRHAHGAAQPLGAKLGEEDGDAKPHGHGDEQRDERTHQGSIDGAKAAENGVGPRIGRPALGGQKVDAVSGDRGPGADDERDDDAAQHQQHCGGGELRHPSKSRIADLERRQRLCAPGVGGR